MMSHVSRCLAAAALVLAAAPANAVTVKLCTLAPEGSPWHKALRDMALKWKSETGGKVRVRIYPGGVCGDEPVMVRKMRVRQIHAAALTATGLVNIGSEFMALQMPMMYRSTEEFDYVRDKLSPTLEAVLEKKGFKLLTWGDAGWVHFFSKTPVVHPDDLKPLRLWVWASDTVAAEAWKDSGYHPVPLPVTEIHTGLASGLIDSFSSTPVAALSFQWFGQAKHMTGVKWARLAGAIVISLRTWNKVPDASKAKLLRIARQAGKDLNGMLPGFRAKAIAAMEKHGLVVHPVSESVRDEWEKRARAGYPRLIGKLVPPELVAMAEKYRNAYRLQIGK
jgi:TRAP-type C4-dicarboxylate transport system substrate-binding protein